MKNRMQFTNEGLDKMKRLSGLIKENEETGAFNAEEEFSLSDAVQMGLLDHVKITKKESFYLGDDYVVVKSVVYNIPFPRYDKPETQMGKSDAWWDKLSDLTRTNPEVFIERESDSEYATILYHNQDGLIYYVGGNAVEDAEQNHP